MDPAPLPPHERSWRHPSELGPTKLDVDAGSRSPVGVLIAGAAAVMVVAALVVVVTPRPSDGPLALTATTTPFVRIASPTLSATTATVTARSAMARPQSTMLFTQVAAYPHAITSAPAPDLDGRDVADREPSGRSSVLVRTDDVTYRVPWSQVPLLDIPDGSVVFDLDGDIVAHIAGGELVSLVAD